MLASELLLQLNDLLSNSIDGKVYSKPHECDDGCVAYPEITGIKLRTLLGKIVIILE